MDRVLLVEPNFPYPTKSKNKANSVHKNFVPIGLLKIGAYHKSLKHEVQLVRGQVPGSSLAFRPTNILVTSIFTYWSRYVWEAVSYYRTMFPKAEIVVGGIYATLHHDRPDFKKMLKLYSAKCFTGLHPEAEKHYPDYSLLNGDIDHHVTHAMRGCIRKCAFCGTWKIEPHRTDKKTDDLILELKAVGKNKIIFFDNNFLANRHIKDILKALAILRINGRPVACESQSGFDGRLMETDPDLAVLLKQSHFREVRIAWDNGLKDHISIKKQVDHLIDAGYNAKEISIFMIYNFSIPYEDMVKKIEYCAKWGVQIVDCRFRPLDSTEDGYNPSKKNRANVDYYIHKKAGWTDTKVRAFRKSVRQHNIWIRYAKDKGLAYNPDYEKWSAIHNTFKYFNLGKPPQWSIIKNSPTWLRRIQMLNRLKSLYARNNHASIDLSGLSKHELDEKLICLCFESPARGK